MIIVDTLAKVRAAPKGRGGDSYADDYKAVAAFQELASETMVAILIVHHTRKAEADDPDDTVSGTLGITGAVDSALILQQHPRCGEYVLYGKGRDLQDYDHPVKFDRETCRWSLSGDIVDDIVDSDARNRVVKALRSSAPGGVRQKGDSCPDGPQ